MKDGAIIINTSRGALINTKHLIQGLKSGKIGAAGLDVYEDEKGIFLEDHSRGILQDNVLARLLSFNNVLITGHQAWFTEEAVTAIANVTLNNILLWKDENKTMSDHPNYVPPE